MKAAQRIKVNGKSFLAGDDLSGLSAKELALIPDASIDDGGDSTTTEGAPIEPVTFEPIDKLTKPELVALAGAMELEVNEGDNKPDILAKIEERLSLVDDEVAEQTRHELIDSLEAHFDPEDTDGHPDFTTMRDEALKVMLDNVLFVHVSGD